ncbi:hypothetical protein MIND_01307300 [Mycena indigotica]|uniref:Uncharacterized protein n=1 Tax=Mycena indigotica TaxID=2126181 RepID=A0A8H6S1U1_9AGAR|nr:uncharacterized protein MIND_01307300 [Mycena indigotica]KAF7290670.1 hypothetical protein MIND_01307300 [Mycena indigotica]
MREHLQVVLIECGHPALDKLSKAGSFKRKKYTLENHECIPNALRQINHRDKFCIMNVQSGFCLGYQFPCISNIIDTLGFRCQRRVFAQHASARNEGLHPVFVGVCVLASVWRVASPQKLVVGASYVALCDMS